jgi:hypothetical protein
MERVLVSVWVPQKVAVLAGKTEFGELPFAPTEEDLSCLTEVERGYLFQRFVSGTDSLRIDCAEPSWGCISQALRREMSADPGHRRTEAETARQKAAQDEARHIATGQAAEAIRLWAISLGGAYAEGIAAGFNMEQRLVDHVQDRIRAALVAANIDVDCITGYRPNTRAWSQTKLSLQRAPDERAFRTLKTVQDALSRIDGIAECVSFYPRIMRCEVDDVGAFKRRFTGVVIGVSCPCWKDSMVVVDTEGTGLA